MKKFSFNLEKVSETKAIRVKQQTQRLAELLRGLECEEMELRSLSTELNGLHEEVLQKTIEGCSASELRDYQRYLSKLIGELQTRKKNIDDYQDKIERLQVKLMELSREKKVLEKLREKRYIKYLQDQTREEQKMLDEMALVTKGIKKLL